MAGAEYGPGEFLFVPNDTTVVLIDEASNRYVIKGLEAVAADPKALEPFKFIPKKPEFLSIIDFLLGKKHDVIAGSRDVKTQKVDNAADHPAWRLHTDLLSKYVPGERFCQIGDQLILKREDRNAVDFVQLGADGVERTKPFVAGSSELRFGDIKIDEGSVKTIALKTKDYARIIEVVGVPSSLLDRPALSVAQFLAQRNCTVQALMISD